LYSQLVEEEAKYVGVLLNLFVEGGSDAVPGIGARAQQNGVARARSSLQARRHLARLHGIYAVIVLSHGKKNGGISGSVGHTVIWRVSVQGLELIGIFYRPKFGDVESPIGIELDPSMS
jgi:hypothetical protein